MAAGGQQVEQSAFGSGLALLLYARRGEMLQQGEQAGAEQGDQQQ